MSNNNSPKIPESVIESLARSTLAAMRRQTEQERDDSLEASSSDKKAEASNRPAQRANKPGK